MVNFEKKNLKSLKKMEKLKKRDTPFRQNFRKNRKMRLFCPRKGVGGLKETTFGIFLQMRFSLLIEDIFPRKMRF